MSGTIIYYDIYFLHLHPTFPDDAVEAAPGDRLNWLHESESQLYEGPWSHKKLSSLSSLSSSMPKWMTDTICKLNVIVTMSDRAACLWI